MFAVVNSYTRASQSKELSAENSYQLQRVGGNILGMLNPGMVRISNVFGLCRSLVYIAAIGHCGIQMTFKLLFFHQEPAITLI